MQTIPAVPPSLTNVTINPDAPNISYSPNELNLTRATTSSDLPLSPTNTGGNMQTASFCSSTNSPPLFVVSDHEGTRHVLCNKDLYSTYLNGTQTVSTNQVSGIPFALEIDEMDISTSDIGPTPIRMLTSITPRTNTVHGSQAMSTTSLEASMEMISKWL